MEEIIALAPNQYIVTFAAVEKVIRAFSIYVVIALLAENEIACRLCRLPFSYTCSRQRMSHSIRLNKIDFSTAGVRVLKCAEFLSDSVEEWIVCVSPENDRLSLSE